MYCRLISGIWGIIPWLLRRCERTLVEVTVIICRCTGMFGYIEYRMIGSGVVCSVLRCRSSHTIIHNSQAQCYTW